MASSNVTIRIADNPPVNPGQIVYFEDDFSTGSKALSQNGFRWGGGQGGSGDAIPLVTNVNPFPGKGYSLQFQFGGNPDLNDDAWSEQRFWIGASGAGGLTEYYLRFWIYFPGDADALNPALGTAAWKYRDPIGPSNNKFFTSWSGAYGSAKGEVAWHTAKNLQGSPNTGMRLWTFRKVEGSSSVSKWPSGPSIPQPNGCDPFFDPNLHFGRWVKIQVHFKASSAPGALDGIMECWRDDVLVQQDLTGVDICALDPVNSGHTECYFQGWSNAGFDLTTRVWIGPVKWASTYITD